MSRDCNSIIFGVESKQDIKKDIYNTEIIHTLIILHILPRSILIYGM